MKILKSKQELEDFMFQNQLKWAFVPTMGNLHEGHLSLVETAKIYSQNVIVSIFVNPAQFAENEDFSTYPRTLVQDISLLEGKISALYLPTANCIYPHPSTLQLNIPHLTNCLCGKFRPHFFNGVMTVLLKFILQIRPQFLILGKKDYQQFLVVREMLQNLDFSTKVVPSQTIRNKNGLALSSRNAYLQNPQKAEEINKILLQAKEEIAQNGTFLQAQNQLEDIYKVQYLELRHANTLKEFQNGENIAQFRLFFAGFLESTRLIDNISMK